MMCLALVACDSAGAGAPADGDTTQCVTEPYQGCYDTDIYWFDSCGQRAAVAIACNEPAVCVAGGDGTPSCVDPTVCTPAATQRCDGGDVYAFDSCGAKGALVADCAADAPCVPDGGGPGVASCPAATGCTDQYDCEGDQYCDTATGACLAQVCEPFTRVCVAGEVHDCASDGGSSTLVATCSGGRRCVDHPGGAQCKCVSADRVACDDDDVYYFDSCGTREQRRENCSAPEVCVESGDSADCAVPTTCTTNQQCQPAEWCDVASGVCKPDVCTYGVSTCAEGEVVQCHVDGSRLDVLDTCTGGEACVANASGAQCKCVNEGARGCYDGDVYNYDSCGVRGPKAENCGAPEVCTEVDGAVDCGLPPVCSSDASCYAGQWCDVATGACRLDVCASGPKACNGQAVQQCAPNGSALVITDTCVGGEVCVPAGASEAQCKCVDAGARGCYDTEIYHYDSCGVRKTLFAYCTAPEICQVGGDGQPFCAEPITCAADSQCASGGYCDQNLCVAQACSPLSRKCDGSGVVQCNARGSGWESYDSCVGGEVCTGGAAAHCACTANAYLGCWKGNVERFDSCGNPTSVADSCPSIAPCSERPTGPECRSIEACDGDGDCAADEHCELEACLPRVCTAGERFCEGQTIRECNANGSDSAVVTDCGAGELCGVGASGPECGCVAAASVGCGADGNVHSFDSCGQEGAVLQACASPLTCVTTGVGATCSDAASCGDDCVCASSGALGCYFGDVYAVTTCNEPASLVEDCPGQITCNSVGGAPACRSSVASASAPYYERSCGLVHQIEHPTTLDGDCRCSNNRVPSAGIRECVSAQYLDPAVSFGAGPRVRPLAQPHINGGLFDAAARELIVGVDWSSSAHPSSGLVLAVNVDSGDRRVVSGGYEDAAGAFTEIGSGPSLRKVIDVRRGPDGKLYAVSVAGTSTTLEIVRVDPTTGARTVAWRAQDAAFGQCPSGDPARLGVQVNDRGFAVDDQGRFYLGFTNTSAYGEGVGVVRVAADGASCAFVTRSGSQPLNTYAGVDVGAGYAFDRGRYQGFALKDGALWAIQSAYLSLVEVDLATGDRTQVSSASTSTGVIGGGPTNASGIGQRWVVWDEARGLWWASGANNRRVLTAIDPATGDRTEAYCLASNPDRPWRELCLGGALIAGYQNEGGMWLDPASGDLLIAHENFSIVRVDVVHGNSMRISL
ncbi:MAG: hypothetical protein CVU56_15620 [Deltaproteobacteria bacterium HGW-Deltaproteobacteria-14]|jgi:hypothetical protein|nr:MAG: hypothetical protein CVU56_15620 [Deltaproteobacteria bacterium HGW-Deltaproteobacteria-14]